MTRWGVDYSWARPGGAALAATGKTFAMRYVPYPGDGGKGLTAPERDDLHANGIAIGLVFESTAGRPKEGTPAGMLDAEQCLASGKRLGFPDDRPFYFAVDFDARGPEVASYFLGAFSVLGTRTGAYGSDRVLAYLRDAGYTSWHWQTYAWSGGREFPGRHVYQYLNGQDINGAVDFCLSNVEDFGQWPAPTQEEDMADPRVDQLLIRLAAGSERGDISDGERAQIAEAWLGDAGKAQSTHDLAASAVVLALKASGTINDGMSDVEVRKVIAEELRKARIVLGG